MLKTSLQYLLRQKSAMRNMHFIQNKRKKARQKTGFGNEFIVEADNFTISQGCPRPTKATVSPNGESIIKIYEEKNICR